MGHLWFVLICVVEQFVNGSMGSGSKREENNSEAEDSRAPRNVRIRADHQSLEVHWTFPRDVNDADHCNIEYKESPFWGPTTTPHLSTVHVGPNAKMHVISGLQTNTRYKLRLACSYGGTRGPSTDWVYASTRTVSVDQNICTGRIPHAFLDGVCIDYTRASWCEFTCEDGFRKNNVPSVLNNNPLWGDDIFIFCFNGSWSTNFEDNGHRMEDICLPEAEFQKCPETIPNGKLEKYCGPATDWLCEFECDPGYKRHSFMYGRLKGFNNMPEKLLCGDDGTWKSGYEYLGVDVSKVCYPVDPQQNCTADIPHGSAYTPCPSGHECSLECNVGYRPRALQGNEWISCLNGDWVLTATKYDATITPQTVCVSEDKQSTCPSNIPNGRVPDGCTWNCVPDCNDGYHPMGQDPLSMAPNTVTCENGKWLTESEPYTGDNICFPLDGMLCPQRILNGDLRTDPDRLTDYGNGREYWPYRCNDGYRYHRGIPHIECLGGKWVTWNERFGIDADDLCIPIQ